ncbi:hypothetical protein [Actinoplanes sp. HUAS TT8]|uniref:hypothetical protein n=1 Tax=Actinoplanes sp. HUAS TT8 TaxID=3447453 RepID=UPI003F528EA4
MAVTDGTADPVWTDVPIGTVNLRRRPKLRLPLDRRAARAARRYAMLTPWVTPVLPLLWLGWVFTGRLSDVSPNVLTTVFAVIGLLGVGWSLSNRRLPVRLLSRDPSGDLRLRDVPVGVAEKWVARNPGVAATTEPVPLRYPDRYYTRLSIGLVVASIVLGVVLLTDGRQDFFLLYPLAPVLFVIGVLIRLKTQRPKTEPRWTLFS